MKTTQQGRTSKIVLFLLIVLFIIAVLFLPFGLKFMTVPEQVFLLGLFVFFLIYTNVFGAYSFVNVLLDLIDKGEDVFDHLVKNLSKDSLLKYLAEGELLVLTETQLLKAKELSSSVFSLVLVYLFAMFVGLVSGVIPSVIFYAATLPAVIVVVIAWFIEIYLDLKFVRVFSEEIKDLEAVARALNMENQLVDQMEDNLEEIEENKKTEKEENQSK